MEQLDLTLHLVRMMEELARRYPVNGSMDHPADLGDMMIH